MGGAPDPAAGAQQGGQLVTLPVSIPRVPWSEVGPEFISLWGYPDGKFEPEHLEILGPTGSGKTYAEATILQDRVKARDSGVIFIATKPLDKTIARLGWPVATTWKEVTEHKQVIFWPRTRLLGAARKAYMGAKIEELLGRLWSKGGAVLVAFDEIATVEGLSSDMREMIKMYWREARSMGITIVAMKQRPQGIQRDMHSESSWVISFRPKDEDDAKRYAEVMGGRKGWLPVLMQLDKQKHEFVLKHERTGRAVITWIDTPLAPLRQPRPYERKN
jgi:hypothetical protein